MATTGTNLLRFEFDGRQIDAREGQSVAGALYAAGVRVFGRSFKYHRPRGLLCCAGRCPNCLMNVDGVPNVRTCVAPARDGLRVRSQNAWPSLDFDALRAIDRLHRFFPVGFYYKMFHKPAGLWPMAEWVLRRVAGRGRIDPGAEPQTHYAKETRHAEVVVVGGGPAGCAAAIAAARRGAEVYLIDESPALGGHLRYQGQPVEAPAEYRGRKGTEVAQALADAVAAEPRITALAGATAFGLYEGSLLGVMQGRTLIQVRARRVLVCTGGHEYPLVFLNNDLPGVFLGRGAQRLLHLDGVRPGSRALVVTATDAGLGVAADLLDAGVAVEAVADLRAEAPSGSPALRRLFAETVPVLAGATIRQARGVRQVIGAVLARLDGRGGLVPGSERDVTCDLICLSTGFEPALGLVAQGGGRLAYDEALGRFVPADLPPEVLCAGEAAGAGDLAAILADGRRAGVEAAAGLGHPASDLALARREADAAREAARAAHRGAPALASVPAPGKKKFVCVCEDVTEQDVRDAVAEGFDEIETLKRYSTISMGPCQGKMCGMPAMHLCARETGRTVAETGTTTSRPPFTPVPIGALAGPHMEPLKRTPMHYRHLALGGEMMDMGQWKRPRAYGPAEAEVKAVREAVGLIDVTTLGKLEVQGRDAAGLLEKVYTTSFADLPIGRVRYGIMCDDAGILLDDGTVTRLADDRFFVTTTSGNIDAMEQWLTWWAAGTGLCAHVVNITAAYAAVNLAGPRARDLLSKLCDRDLSPAALPYMAGAEGMVADIPGLLVRIGFVGELAYEIHVPSAFGEGLWEALVEVGKDFGLAPFGVEAQRFLRLEKGHIIIGQDTDALSNALEAGLGWAVKFDKPDFIGRAGLLRAKREGLRNRLVGFEVPDGTVVEEGDQVVDDAKRVIGRVTSARMSPTLHKSIGLAWLPAHRAATGSPFTIWMSGRPVPATVVRRPFYDPDGHRLRM
jgi:sarcosine oxidase subunit alpha